VNQTIQLPVYGEPVRYPFDNYRFTLGVLIGHENADGTQVAMSPGQAQLAGQQLFMSMRM